MLQIFEDTEAVIKMMIKGRSPTMRHVSRTHRVSLDWLSDRINLDPKIQIRYIDTKHQMADILTTGSFTRDEWNNLLDLFCNISHFSSLCCAQNFSLTSCTRTMAKRMQEQNGDNRIVATSKPTTMNLAVSVSTSSSTVHSPIAHCIEKPGDTESTLSKKLVKYRETCRDRRRPGTPELSWRIGEYVETRRFRKLGNRRQWQSLATQSPCYNKLCAAHGEGFSIVRQWYGCSPTDRMKNLEVNTAIWSIFMSVTLQAAVHLGKDYTENLGSTKNHTLKSLRLISSDWEVDHRSDRRYWTDHDWLAAVYVERDGSVNWQSCSTLQLLKPTSFLTQCYVWEVSVTNQSKHGKAGSNGSWKHKDLDRIDAEQVEFEWTNFPEFTTLGVLVEIKRWWLNYSVNQSNSKEVSSSCHSTLTLIGESEETKKIVFRMPSELLSMLEDSRKDTCRCLDLVPRRNGTELMSTNRMDSGIKLHDAQLCRKRTSHIPCYDGSDETVELILRTDISFNQLCIYGAVAGVCKELARDSRAGREW